MPTNLKKFMNAFATGSDPALAANFRKDPEAAMSSAHISAAHQKLIMAGDSKALSGLMNPNGVNAAGDSDNIIVLVFSPAPMVN